jgi:hypothetical protein
MRNACKILVGKPEGKRRLRRPRCEWKDNIEMDLKRNREKLDWIHLVQKRDKWRVLVYTVMNLRVTKKAGNFLTG